ncbi:unnamed protein product [Lactuca virosa]|uniref:Nicotianamine synthase n=1 Tax=Lactuca virosa TaxID=75947 RepID=A0AAU9PKJ2_9ASTR|nr:unnamed protein product [Lactuca virosa]
MVFHTANITDVTDELKGYDVIFLAALVGMDTDEKVKVIDHLAKYMVLENVPTIGIRAPRFTPGSQQEREDESKKFGDRRIN